MKTKIMIAIVMGILFSNVFAYDQDSVSGFNNTGWNPPLNNNALTTDSCCNYDSSEYHDNWDYSNSCGGGECGHTGVDMGMDNVSVGDPVYAIANGTIIGRRLHCTGSTTTYNLSVVFIRHSTSDGKEFVGIYGHTKPKDMSCNGVTSKYNSKTNNIPISKGEVVGYLAKFGDPHLHFGLAKGDTSYTTLSSGWGRYTGPTPPSHFIDPEDYLTSNLPERNFWTGNGSIISHHAENPSNTYGGSRANIDDDEYPYAILKDVTKAHSKKEKAIGFFQWQVSDSCEKLKINYSGSSKANITVGSWGTRKNDMVFKNVSLPFILGESNTGFNFSRNGAGWYVVSVRLNDKLLSSGNRISADCTTENSTTMTSDKKLKGRNVFIGDHHWNGNASIISRIYEKSSHINYSVSEFADWPYGAFKDVSIAHESQAKPVVFFQWMSSDICNQITIDAPSLSESEKDVALGYKSWNSLSEIGKSGKLPITLSSDGRLWTVVKVAFYKPVSHDAKVYATCSGF